MTQRMRRVVIIAARSIVSPITLLSQTKPREKDLKLPIGGIPGALDAITDVTGVEVGHGRGAMHMLRPCSVCLIALSGFVAPLQRIEAQTSACPIDTTSAWVRTSRAWSDEQGLRWSNDSLRTVLLALRDRDQAARMEFGARVGDSLYARRLISLDSALAAEMEMIIDRFGLPTKSLVGPAGSDAALLIIQHNWPLQKRAFALAAGTPKGELSPEKLAMLEDRILVHEGKPQRFGTQFSIGADGMLRFAPNADISGLDARRSATGMPPLKLYVCFLEESGMRVDRSSLPPT